VPLENALLQHRLDLRITVGLAPKCYVALKQNNMLKT
jgi:hypothetical protein